MMRKKRSDKTLYSLPNSASYFLFFRVSIRYDWHGEFVTFFQNDGDLPGCVPLTYCLISRKSQYIAVSDVSGFTVGEVFYPTPDQGSCDVDIFITGKQHSLAEPVTGKENGCLIMGWG